MRVLGATATRQRATWATAALATAVVLLSLVACTPTGSQSERVTPTAQPLYPQVKTYPRIVVAENLDYGSDTGGRVDVCLPPDSTRSSTPRAAVISIHGGSWRAGDKANINWRSVCQWLASEGFVTFSVGYGLAPQHPFPAGIDDVRAAVRYMRSSAVVQKYDIDPKRIGAFGGSAGGNLAALLGVEGTGSLSSGSRIAAVAELSGPTNLTGDGIELADFRPLELSYLACASFEDCPQAVRASPLFQVDDSDPPFFIAHSLDERIPLEQSSAFVRALREHDIDTTFVTVKGHLHSIAMLSDDMRSRISNFFHSALDQPAG
ncbi:alpha/beta hydrolase [Glaciihabitans sp. INWT7]|uniref:alpha/beta hydrolase n=1 Tax=Glaciihabitans sp. INWT7 TaxID=2596912 RepID=UPI001629E92B|nr:alpha/beta hydrolase [Glaciihabitans sp. INWT7]